MTSIEDLVRIAVKDAVNEALAPIIHKLDQIPFNDNSAIYLSVEKAASIAEVHPDTIRSWIREKKLPRCHAGRVLRVRRDELRRFLESNDVKDETLSPEDQATAILSHKIVA